MQGEWERDLEDLEALTSLWEQDLEALTSPREQDLQALTSPREQELEVLTSPREQGLEFLERLVFHRKSHWSAQLALSC